jgi:hypothetical protein
MAKATKKETQQDVVNTEEQNISTPSQVSVTPNDLEWTDHVLSLLSDDEKISGNPTTDGLRRVFEKALDCKIIMSTSSVVQSPSPDNEKRATVVHSITYCLNTGNPERPELNTVSIDGSADVYWGNCDKVYRNHPVAVAETRAEGRALRRALKLRKVVAAEELAKDIEDHPDHNSVSKITNNQINFIDVLSKRLNINVTKLLQENNMENQNIYALSHDDAVTVIRLLSSYQQDMTNISENIIGYHNEWK